MFYLVTPPEETGWHVDRNELVSKLRAQWPDVTIWLAESNEYPTRDVVWRYAGQIADLEGAQDVEGQTQRLDGQLADVADYVSWWRAQVPSDQELVLCSEDYSAYIPLEAGASAAQIAELLAS